MNRDQIEKLSRFLILEWSELQDLTIREPETVKSFLSTHVDVVRLAYGNRVEKYPRKSIIVGTTNSRDFLRDTTGSRRFWILSLPSDRFIDLEYLASVRDTLWGSAYKLYLEKENHWLSLEDDRLNTELNTDYRYLDPWLEALTPMLNHAKRTNGFVSMRSLMAQIVGDSDAIKSLTPSNAKRLGNILRGEGFEDIRVRINGVQCREWKYKKCLEAFSVSHVSQNSETLTQQGFQVRQQETATLSQSRHSDSTETAEIDRRVTVETLDSKGIEALCDSSDTENDINKNIYIYKGKSKPHRNRRFYYLGRQIEGDLFQDVETNNHVKYLSLCDMELLGVSIYG